MRAAVIALVGFILMLPIACGPGEVPRNPSSGPALDAGTVRCADYASCGNESPCPGRVDCIKLAGCLYAICAPASTICNIACTSDSCLVLDSSPLQMRKCSDGRSIRGG